MGSAECVYMFRIMTVRSITLYCMLAHIHITVLYCVYTHVIYALHTYMYMYKYVGKPWASVLVEAGICACRTQALFTVCMRLWSC